MSTDSDDLRSTLEAAFNEQENADTPPPQEDVGSETDTTEPVEAEEQSPEATEAKPDEPKPEPKPGKAKSPPKKDDSTPAPKELKPKQPYENAPDSWKPELKTHWEKVPPEVRQEIYRREQEIVQTLQQTTGERRLAHEFQQAVYPFEVFMRAENVHPLQAVRELLGQAAILRVGTPAQKAQLVANVVKQFNVGIEDLDNALVGQAIPDEEGKLTKLLQQQLAPVNQFMQEIGSLRQQRAQKTDQEMDNEIDTFANDPKNKYFYEVNTEMADILEIAARQNRNMSMKEAYDKACKMNDRVQQLIAQEKQQEINRKKAAGSSLPSRSAPPDTGGSKGDSLRDSLLESWDRLANQ